MNRRANTLQSFSFGHASKYLNLYAENGKLMQVFRALDELWRSSTLPIPVESENPCQGWITQYELWNIADEEPVLIESPVIPIDETEIRLQCHCFRPYSVRVPKSEILSEGLEKEMSIQLPSSISDNLETITILTKF